jgi:hypothetical protein
MRCQRFLVATDRKVMQTHLELIPHVVEKEIIQQRVKDGYINATAMCKAAGKRWPDYNRLGTTTAFIGELSSVVQIPTTELVQSVSGGTPEHQGTWVHPQVAIHLAQWLSPEFAVKVSQWVYDWMSGRSGPSAASLPYHLQRYLLNNDQVPAGYFSILAELSIMLIAPLEKFGYRLPPEMVPDISSGRLFCKWLRDEKGLDTDALPVYFHRYPDGRVVPAKLYPESLLADFRRHVREIWIPKHAIDYFRSRDGAALQYLHKLLPSADSPRILPKKSSFWPRKQR